MKRSIAFLVINLVFLLGVSHTDGQAQGTTPTLSVNLVLSSLKYLFDDPTDPIKAELTIANTGNQPIVTTAGFSQKPFHLFLVFVGPDGKPITAGEAGEGIHEGGPPKIVLVNGAYVQVEEIEILPVGFQKIITIPDLTKFYPLTKATKYSVNAVIPIRTYSTFFTSGNANFAAIDAFNFAGAIDSGGARYSLIADLDGDGYSFPEPDPRISKFNIADCDDHDPAVNPGMTETFGDGKDNDCNPTTLDTLFPQPGDLNGDGKADCNDLTIVKASFGKRTGQAGFDVRADINRDGIVNVRDLAFVTQKLPPGSVCK